MNKQDHIAEKQAADFNAKYPVGSKVKWCNYIGADPVEMIVKSEAYVMSGTPVCFFENVRGCCSVEPDFIKD